jgi:hypothetical protein
VLFRLILYTWAPTWTYTGTGYTAAPGAELALASAVRAREHHDEANPAA